jgi:hypothetical protein|tara:strand:+ start:496 stop:654 length:159 start_codon:yes stop_codon:yes gene_type:complete
MGYPTHSGHGRIERNKLVSKKIKLLVKEGKKPKQAVAIALETYPKRKKLPLT